MIIIDQVSRRKITCLILTFTYRDLLFEILSLYRVFVFQLCI